MSRLPMLLPWLILVITLGVTWLLWDHERQVSRKELRAQFDFALRDTVSRVEQRVAAHEQMLRGVQGLLAATGLFDRRAIREYVETLQLDANFSGVQAIGVVELVPAGRKATHEAAMRRLGFADYAIYPAGERPFYGTVIQREPGGWRDPLPLGLDALADPARRLALETARDSGMAAITAKVRLAVDKKPEAQPGFIMYLPIFSPGQARDSLAQRRAHIVGWVYASFYMDDFMAGLYGKQVPGVELAIYDGADPVAGALMYRSATADKATPAEPDEILSANEYMVVAGSSWTLRLTTQSEFADRFGRDAAPLIALAGISVSLTLALLAWFMVTGRARALRLAAVMTSELRHMAQHDPLTGLPNRALFSDRLQNELARAKRHGDHFAMIFLDLDRFKPINDSYGHAVGDLLLKQVAMRLQQSVRASDTVGRIGGDEFVVLMPALAEGEAARGLAEKLRHAIGQPFMVDGRELNISCSLGVAVYPDDGGDDLALSNSADAAMYRAKAGGRDKVQTAR
ncbi:CHASE domain-containing protein [Dechloromonas sp. XY25]|uniref:CHASE domain-containing protein n=1 Tax=Dechloromonas hankyongensis TaxID=2908002 RepID=A0ABS9JXE3_9RHOO|nr:CHASE domain-containing protein [Dechloromonas hankyongensis]MCG2575581.1 CHASE domain-containing protein [Dechloromonas hankyongensis]